MAKKITLKKYPNRRLYNTESSSYVTLSQVSELIRQGNQIEVIDAKTNIDVTAFILTQIIMEKAKNNHSLLPPHLLHLIIQFGDNDLHDFFDNYLEKTLETYLMQKQSMEKQFKAYLDMGMDFSNMTQKAFRDLSPFKDFFQKTSNDKNDEQE